jgi:hypothetical protein
MTSCSTRPEFESLTCCWAQLALGDQWLRGKSDAFMLKPGDLILTGTPAGVALGRDPAPWLQPGQLCEVEIEGVGRIANRIVQEGETHR